MSTFDFMNVSVPRLSVSAVLASDERSQDVTALVDTGADVELVIGSSLARALDAPDAGSAILRESAVGQQFPVRKVRLTISIGAFEEMLEALVLPGLGDETCLIGLPLISRMRGEPELESALLEVLGRQTGLTLFLSTRLLPWDQTMLHAFALAAAGDIKGDVRVAEYTETGDDSCRVRLTGSNPDDLDRVAQHLAEVTWKTGQKHAIQAAGLLQVDAVVTSLDHIREHLDKQELWAEESGAREMLEDQAAAHIAKKDVALVRTWEQKGLRALWETAKNRVGREVASEVEDGVKGLLPGGGDE